MAYWILFGTVLAMLICKLMHGWINRIQSFKDIPGPVVWPIFGNIFQMDLNEAHKTFYAWAKEYGKIFKVRIFLEDVVVLNDYESVHQMLTSEVCSARLNSYRNQGILVNGWNNIVQENYSPEWNERKKAVTRALNAYGSGGMKIEHITMESIDKLLNDVVLNTKDFSKSVDMRPLIHICIARIITTLYFGRKLEEFDLLELLEMERNFANFFSVSGLIAAVDLVPFLRYLPLKGIQEPIEGVEKIRSWIEKKCAGENSQRSMDNTQGIKAMLGQYVNKVTNKTMSTNELMGISLDLIVAGFITSTATLYSLILVLINLPKIQDKMYEEIQLVTKGRRLQVTDRSQMPYVRAVMEENFRYSTILPLGVPHFTKHDTSISGKHIPGGTSLIANHWMLHHDSEFFDQPWEFRPERFLNEDGDVLTRDHEIWKHSLPFSTGRRVCPGEGLARNRTFLILASLVQRFKFLPEDERNIPSCDPRGYECGALILPSKYEVKIVER